MDKDKKLEKLKTKYRIYRFITERLEVERGFDDDKRLSLDYLYSKVEKLERQISKLEKPIVAEIPKYGPGDEVRYEGDKCTVMSVNHKNKTYNLKTPSDKVDVKWESVN